MNCQDFETIWSDILDADHRGPDDGTTGSFLIGPAVNDAYETLRSHAQLCPGCRIRMSQYETLWRAIQSWEHASKPAPSNDLTDRILAAVAADSDSVSLQNKKLWKTVWIATGMAAAALVAMVIIPWRDRPAPKDSKLGAAIAQVDRSLTDTSPATRTPPDTRALRQALSEAGEATWELAYAASAPALRIGRQVLEPVDEPPVSLEGFDSPESSNPGEIMSEVLNEFGQDLSSGVRPLSNSAIRALDFLRGVVPAPERAIKNPPLPPPTSSKGA